MSIRLYSDREMYNTDQMLIKNNGAHVHLYNGICELEPSSCIIRERAGGEYTLTMKHPYDARGKYLKLAEEYIICAPVPIRRIPQVDVYGVSAWGVLGHSGGGHSYGSISIYGSVMTTAKSEYFVYRLKNNAVNETWNKKKEYKIGDYVLYGTPPTKVYKAIDDTEKGEKPDGTYTEDRDNPWQYQAEITDYPNPQDDAPVIGTINNGEVFYKIADFDEVYMYVYRSNGQIGFVKTAMCEELLNEHISPRTVEATGISEQDFRIYKVDFDDIAKVVTVEARHISYDLRHNGLMRCEVNDEAPMTAIAKIKGKTIDATMTYNVFTNLKPYNDNTEDGVDIDADWSWINPVQALLDPDTGYAGITKAQVIRDNRTFYLLEDKDNDHGFVIQYGKNMLGVKFSRNTDEVITRIIPRADNGTEGYLFLDALYVDSPQRSTLNYPFDRIEMLESEYYVGQEIEKADGSTWPMGENSVKQKMRKEAKKRFKIDKVDCAKVSMEIDFLMLGDTEEYKQFRHAQELNLYDTVKIITGPSGIETEAQVSEYEYDSILRRYNKIALGTIYKQNRGKVASYMLAKGGVNYESLAPGLRRKIVRG